MGGTIAGEDSLKRNMSAYGRVWTVLVCQEIKLFRLFGWLTSDFLGRQCERSHLTASILVIERNGLIKRHEVFHPRTISGRERAPFQKTQFVICGFSNTGNEMLPRFGEAHSKLHLVYLAV